MTSKTTKDQIDEAWNKLVDGADVFFCTRKFKEEGRKLHEILDKLDIKLKELEMESSSYSVE